MGMLCVADDLSVFNGLNRANCLRQFRWPNQKINVTTQVFSGEPFVIPQYTWAHSMNNKCLHQQMKKLAQRQRRLPANRGIGDEIFHRCRITHFLTGSILPLTGKKRTVNGAIAEACGQSAARSTKNAAGQERRSSSFDLICPIVYVGCRAIAARTVGTRRK